MSSMDPSMFKSGTISRGNRKIEKRKVLCAGVSFVISKGHLCLVFIEVGMKIFVIETVRLVDE